MNKTKEQLIEQTEGLILDIIWLLNEETKNVNLINFQADNETITKGFYIESIDKKNLKDKSNSIQDLYKTNKKFKSLIDSGEKIQVIMYLISHIGKNQTTVNFSYEIEVNEGDNKEVVVNERVNKIEMSEQLLRLIKTYNNMVN